MQRKIEIDSLITHELPMERINEPFDEAFDEAFDRMHAGESIRTVVEL